MGYHAAQFLSQEDDAIIVGVMERDGAVMDPNGIDIDGLHKYIHDNGGVKGYKGYTPSRKTCSLWIVIFLYQRPWKE